MFKINDNIIKFVTENTVACDRALGVMFVDIERLSKAQVPIGKPKGKGGKGGGALRASGHTERLGPLNYRFIYNMVYARFQEFGGDGKRVVRNYSYPGKKAFFLRDPGNQVAKNFVQYIKNEVKKIKVM